MITITGQQIDFLHPEKTKVLPRDLCQGLQYEHRYGGHIGPYNVLSHLLFCKRMAEAWGYSPLEIAMCAAHDLHEAYTKDISSPMKEVLGEAWRRIEEPWERHVLTSVGFQWPIPPDLYQKYKKVDKRALVVETAYFEFPLYDYVSQGDVESVTPTEIDMLRRVLMLEPHEKWQEVWGAVGMAR